MWRNGSASDYRTEGFVFESPQDQKVLVFTLFVTLKISINYSVILGWMISLSF